MLQDTMKDTAPLGLFHHSCDAKELRSKGEYANHTQQTSLERFITIHMKIDITEKLSLTGAMYDRKLNLVFP